CETRPNGWDESVPGIPARPPAERERYRSTFDSCPTECRWHWMVHACPGFCPLPQFGIAMIHRPNCGPPSARSGRCVHQPDESRFVDWVRHVFECWLTNGCWD